MTILAAADGEHRCRFFRWVSHDARELSQIGQSGQANLSVARLPLGQRRTLAEPLWCSTRARASLGGRRWTFVTCLTHECLLQNLPQFAGSSGQMWGSVARLLHSLSVRSQIPPQT